MYLFISIKIIITFTHVQKRTLSRSLEVHVHFNARTRVDIAPEQSPALDCAGKLKN